MEQMIELLNALTQKHTAIHGPTAKIGISNVFLRQNGIGKVQQTNIFGHIQTVVPWVDMPAQNWKKDQLVEGVVILLPRRIWTDIGTFRDFKMHAVLAQGRRFERKENWGNVIQVTGNREA